MTLETESDVYFWLIGKKADVFYWPIRNETDIYYWPIDKEGDRCLLLWPIRKETDVYFWPIGKKRDVYYWPIRKRDECLSLTNQGKRWMSITDQSGKCFPDEAQLSASAVESTPDASERRLKVSGSPTDIESFLLFFRENALTNPFFIWQSIQLNS